MFYTALIVHELNVKEKYVAPASSYQRMFLPDNQLRTAKRWRNAGTRPMLKHQRPPKIQGKVP